jgi:7-cyano-7-deazaguanine synthase in queuosine biosynthesis
MAVTPFKSSTAQIQLIPWDPESPAHVERMIQQRIACGWKHDKIEGYRDLQREGKVTLQWVVSLEMSHHVIILISPRYWQMKTQIGEKG